MVRTYYSKSFFKVGRDSFYSTPTGTAHAAARGGEGTAHLDVVRFNEHGPRKAGGLSLLCDRQVGGHAADQCKDTGPPFNRHHSLLNPWQTTRVCPRTIGEGVPQLFI